MAETTTITRPAPVLEASLTNFLKSIDPLVGKQIKTSAYAPTIAAESQLQQDARTAAAGLGSLTGPQAFEAFMSPYQQQVIDATKASFENKRLQERQQIADQAVAAGAFGGGREGVQRGVFDAQTNLGLAQLEADLRAQGLQQAQAQQAQAISQFGALSGLEQAQATQNLALLGQAGGVQSGLASLQPQLVAGSIGDLSTIGQQSQALNQAALDAQAAANREAAYETQQRLGFFGSQISPLMGAYGAQTQFATTQQTPPSTLQTILGTGLGIAGLARAFG